MQSLGGALSCTSELGVGTTFEVSLRVAAPPAEVRSAPTPS